MTAFRFADTMLARLDELGRISESPDFLLRTFLTPEQKQAHEKVAGWMREAGMITRQDAAGNQIGRIGIGDPPEAFTDAAALLLGSHLDTVSDAGRYDGMLGVLTAIEVVRLLAEPLRGGSRSRSR